VRDGNLRFRCAFKILRAWLYRAARNRISKCTISNVSPPCSFSHSSSHPTLVHVRNELDSGRNPAPHSPTTDPAARGGSGDLPGDGRKLNCCWVVGQQDPCLQLSNRRVESDVSWVSGRSLGRLVGRERVVVVAFAEEEEYQFRICWVGTGDFVGCEWQVR
jgi:hypothetical protein